MCVVVQQMIPLDRPRKVHRRMGRDEWDSQNGDKFKELLRSKRKDSGQTEEMPSPHTSDQSYGSHSLSQDASPRRSSSSFIASDPEMFYMAGALEPDTYHLRSRSDVSVDMISQSGRTRQTGRPASNPSSSRSSYASVGANDDPSTPSPDTNTEAGVRDDPHRWQKLNGYSPAPTPSNGRSQGNLFNRLANFRDTSSLRQFAKQDPLRPMAPSTAPQHVASSSHDALAFPPAVGFPSDSPPCSVGSSPRPESLDDLGVLPPRPSVESVEDIAVPTFTPIFNAGANASAGASPATSLPHSRTPSPSCVLDASFPLSPSGNPAEFGPLPGSPFALPPLYMGLSASVVFQPEISDLSWPAGLLGTPGPADSCERPLTMETALDDASMHEGLDLTRLAASEACEREYERRAETGNQRGGNDMPFFDTDALLGLEGLEGYLFAERAMRWTDDERCTTPPRGRSRL
ncbi:hypothetical protein N0V90_012718 [Kalmusia sp. IMI 367209]|nr:hypothetical protein N0V90_012718 [Kalmusia sp. IMI 367209]